MSSVMADVKEEQVTPGVDREYLVSGRAFVASGAIFTGAVD